MIGSFVCCEPGYINPQPEVTSDKSACQGTFEAHPCLVVSRDAFPVQPAYGILATPSSRLSSNGTDGLFRYQ